MLRTIVIVLGLCVVVASVAIGGRFGNIAPPIAAEGSAPVRDGEMGRVTRSILADDTVVAHGLRLAQQAAVETAAKDAVPALTDALTASRQAALTAGTEPIPAAIRRKLAGFFPKPMLDQVRHRVGWGMERPPLAPLFLMPRIKAMTLTDIIVFRDQTAAGDVRLWVHELGHVQQFARWGTRGFAERYVQDYKAVEDDAWAVFDRYDTWARAEGRLAATNYEPVPAVR